jgi:transcriptional regulator with XRE-family HTH domain
MDISIHNMGWNGVLKRCIIYNMRCNAMNKEIDDKILDYNKKEVGKRLQLARTAKSYTQQYVAQKCGVEPKQISMIERGASGVKISTLIALCDLLDTSLDYVLRNKYVVSNAPIENLISSMNNQQQGHAIKLLTDFIEALNDTTII